MSPAAIIQQAAADGVTLRLSAALLARCRFSEIEGGLAPREKVMVMQTIEADVTPYTDESAPATNPGNYEPVRFNAMKHGILSRLTVLPHEDAGEFADLLTALIEEHRPTGMTEQHLTEELAAIIWRKRRVLLAEGAKVNRSLRGRLQSLDSYSSAIPGNAVPFDPRLVSANVDFRELFSMSEEDRSTYEQEAILDREATKKAVKILRHGGDNAYTKALRALLPASRDWWLSNQEEDGLEETAQALLDFINTEMLPSCSQSVAVMQHLEAIRRQVVGEGIEGLTLESLSRYETHLDRKFERTLAMLIKMKELRCTR